MSQPLDTQIAPQDARPVDKPRATFYQLLQMDARGLWAAIHAAPASRDKARLGFAMTLRSILLVAFAILFIGVLTQLFGQNNTGLVVAGFCILLGIKHVPYGFHAADSVIALGLVIGAMILSGTITLVDNSLLSLITNFILVTLILVFVANDPPMGNAGLYIFGYLFVSQTPVTGADLTSRCILGLIIWIMCSAVLVHKHHSKFSDIRLRDLIENFSLKNPTSIWQLRLAVGVACVLLIGDLLGIPRGVWLGYACMSVLLPYGEEKGSSLKRAGLRLSGVVIGSTLFYLFSWFVPTEYRFLFGPLAGICIGFSNKYIVDSALNCFGALLLAESVYGMGGSAILRIWDNLLGVVFAVIFTALFSYLADRTLTKTKEVGS